MTARRITSFEEWCAIKPGTLLQISEYSNGFIDPQEQELFLSLEFIPSNECISAWNMTENNVYDIAFGEGVWVWKILSEPEDT